MVITAAECKEILAKTFDPKLNWRLTQDLAQAWLAHEAQVGELQHTIDDAALSEGQNKAHIAILEQQLECERQATSDAQAVMERCEEENATLEAQLAEAQAECERLAQDMERLRERVRNWGFREETSPNAVNFSSLGDILGRN